MKSLNNTSTGGVAGGGEKGDSLKRGIRFSHFARMESSQVLEAAVVDLINIFQIKVSYSLSGHASVYVGVPVGTGGLTSQRPCAAD